MKAYIVEISYKTHNNLRATKFSFDVICAVTVYFLFSTFSFVKKITEKLRIIYHMNKMQIYKSLNHTTSTCILIIVLLYRCIIFVHKLHA
jgi:hypothetical protein